MSDEWEVVSMDDPMPILPPYFYRVRNTETGEVRRLYVNAFQDVGDAIAAGQWADDDEEEVDDD